MLKLKPIILFLFVFISINSTCQQRYLSVSANPAVLYVPDVVIGLQAGAHYYFRDHWSLGSEIAFPFSKHEDSSKANPKYLRLAIELKYFKNTYSDKNTFYISLSSFFIRRSFEMFKGGVYYKERDTLSYEYNKANVSSPVLTITPKLGFEINLNDRIKVDMFGGAGLRIVATSYKNIQGLNSIPSIKRTCKIFPSPDPAHWFNETLLRPQFSAGFRLHYMFGKK